MTTMIRLFLLAVLGATLAGCQNLSQGNAITCTSVAPCNGNTVGSPSTQSPLNNNVQNATNVIGVIKQEPIIINATGYAAINPNKRYTKSQAKLMALRSSTLDAYRNLSERVYDLKIDGTSSLSNMVLQHDELRSYVDAYLVGAKIVSQREHEDGTFETVVEMALQENFRQCVSDPTNLDKNPKCQIRPGYRAVNVESGAHPTTNFYTIE